MKTEQKLKDWKEIRNNWASVGVNALPCNTVSLT